MEFRTGEEPVENDEYIFRRVPLGFYRESIGKKMLTIDSFTPSKLDTTGLSVQRAKYKSIQDAAANPRGKQYYIAKLLVRDLRANGIEVVPKPLHAEDPTHPNYDPGHAELPQLTFSEKNGDSVLRFSRLLAGKLCISIEGPYP